MTQTLTGLFDQYDDARRAAGITERGRVEVESHVGTNTTMPGSIPLPGIVTKRLGHG